MAEYVEPDEYGQYEPGSQLLYALEQHLVEGVSLGGEGAARAVSRYGYGYQVGPTHHEEFLEELAVICLEDAYEFAGEHGDDPTGALHPFEVEAAKAGVHLPRRYFERRSRWSEAESEQAVAEHRADQEGS